MRTSTTMLAEIIAIGSELTSGAKLDTNSQWLSNRLSAIGIPVRFHCTMADDRVAMLEVFQTAIRRSDIVLITGGLGPTLDDLTRELIAECLGSELVLDVTSLHVIEDMFAKRGRVMAERNRIQAMFPAGCEAIPNPIGTAPGIRTEISRDGHSPCQLAAMPGVPSEMRRMYLEQIEPWLPHGSQVIRRATVHTFGQGESNIEELLGDLTKRNRNPEVGITASSATITLRIEAHGSTGEECETAIAQTESIIRQTLGDYIFGTGHDTLESVVLSELTKRGSTVACVESASHGLLGHSLAAGDPGSGVFRGGIVLGENSRWPAADSESGAPPAPVSEDQTATLARNCLKHFHVDYALAVSAFSITAGDVPPVVYVALAHRSGVEIHQQAVLNDLTISRPRAVKTAVNLLRLHLLSQE
ncbi:MAG: CinA family nicotinamide mononucleotide deamidase-related protein [Planctomycetaceae bacterium]